MITEKLRAQRGHAFVPPPDDTPGLYDTEAVPLAERVVRHHYFVGTYDWWVIELDRNQDLAWGITNVDDPASAEWGTFSLEELESLWIPSMVYVIDWPPGTVKSCTSEGEISADPGSPKSVTHVIVERDLDWQPNRVADIPELADCSLPGVR